MTKPRLAKTQYRVWIGPVSSGIHERLRDQLDSGKSLKQISEDSGVAYGSLYNFMFDKSYQQGKLRLDLVDQLAKYLRLKVSSLSSGIVDIEFPDLDQAREEDKR